MLMCNEKITLIKRTYDIEGDTDSYSLTIIDGASWFVKNKIDMQGEGFKSADIVYIRIPEGNMPPDTLIENGDFVHRGEIDAEITRRKDLDGLAIFSVISVGDNRRGNLRHWAVVAK